jgi:hypothetical protein
MLGARPTRTWCVAQHPRRGRVSQEMQVETADAGALLEPVAGANPPGETVNRSLSADDGHSRPSFTAPGGRHGQDRADDVLCGIRTICTG